jgi:hypothetical protein
MVEPGLDLHEWKTRWQELQDLAADDPAETLPEIVRFVRQMLVERGFDLSEPVTAEGEDPDVVRDFLAARDVAAAVEAGDADPGDIAVALENLREIYEYVVTDRAAP